MPVQIINDLKGNIAFGDPGRFGALLVKKFSTIIAIIIQVSVTLKELGLDNPSGYHIQDLFDNHNYGTVTPDRRFKVDVNPSGSEYRVSLM